MKQRKRESANMKELAEELSYSFSFFALSLDRTLSLPPPHRHIDIARSLAGLLGSPLHHGSRCQALGRRGRWVVGDPRRGGVRSV